MAYLEKLQKIMARESGGKDRQQRTFSTNLEQILKLRLSELANRNIKIFSEVLGCEIWLCGTEEMANQLRQDDPEVVTYTVEELRKLYKLQPSPKVLRGIHNTKIVFPKSKIYR